MAAVGVLCARVRVEEKQLLAALAEAGVSALPLPPAGSPLPVGPFPPLPLAAEALNGVAARVVIDRCQERAVAAAVLPVWRSLGVTALDAGLAATGTRLAVAATLPTLGLPRPQTRLAASAAAALAALDEIGYPATLLPLTPGTASVTLLDRDSAEAVLEHREILGSPQDAIALVQAGALAAGARLSVVVVGGQAVTLDDPGGTMRHPARVIGLAETTARGLGAAVVGVELALTPDGPIVWDVNPVPEFRGATPLGRVTVAEALADLASRLLTAGLEPGPPCEPEAASRTPVAVRLSVADEGSGPAPLGVEPATGTGAGWRREAAGGVALSA